MGFPIAAPNQITPQGRLIASAITYLSLPGVATGHRQCTDAGRQLCSIFPNACIDADHHRSVEHGGYICRRRKTAAHGDLCRRHGMATDVGGHRHRCVSGRCGWGCPAASSAPPRRGYLLRGADGAPTVRTVRGIPANGFWLPTLGANPIVYSLRADTDVRAFPATGTVIDSVSGEQRRGSTGYSSCRARPDAAPYCWTLLPFLPWLACTPPADAPPVARASTASAARMCRRMRWYSAAPAAPRSGPWRR